MINVFKKRSRTEPHQDSAASKAIVKWENAGKGIRQTGFVPSVYGLALVYGKRRYFNWCKNLVEISGVKCSI